MIVRRALLTSFLAAAGPLAPCSAREIRVLFIGNSYTYVNDLPKTLARIAQSLGDRVETETAAPGGYTLEQHVRSADTKRRIESRVWDFVVLQEQSQKPALSFGKTENHVESGAAMLSEQITFGHPETRVVFFETWAHESGDRSNCPRVPEVCTYAEMQRRTNAQYHQLASELSASLSPVGEAWELARKRLPKVRLYDGDGVHPSSQGTYLAACVFYATLFHKSPVGAQALGLPGATAQALQRTAGEVVLKTRPPRSR